jgi:hypothetical protein
MDKTALVNIDVSLGEEVLKALDAARIETNVALWAWLSEYEDWRFVLASRTLDREGLRRGYEMVNRATDAAGIAINRAPSILILKMTDPFIRELRRIFGKGASVNGMRLGGQSIGNRFVQEAYVYRIA